MTLVFLGDVSEATGAAVTAAIGRPVHAPPFAMALHGFGVFPPHGAPRAIWIGVTDGADHLHDLQREVAHRIRETGVSPESRPFRPHLTLGRWRQSRPADRRQMLAVASTAEIARVSVSAATLYLSRLSSAGPSYTALARATLSDT